MNLETLREYCLSLPHATEKVQWGSDLLFCIGGKMFLVAATEPHAHVFSFKAADERFHELLEREGVKPAPYLARAKWVAVERYNTLPPEELRALIREAYDQVFAKLPKKAQVELQKKPAAKARTTKKKSKRR